MTIVIDQPQFVCSSKIDERCNQQEHKVKIRLPISSKNNKMIISNVSSRLSNWSHGNGIPTMIPIKSKVPLLRYENSLIPYLGGPKGCSENHGIKVLDCYENSRTARGSMVKASSLVDDKKTLNHTSKDLLDGGFTVPKTNSFGQTFRNYDAESERKKKVEEFYRINHINQSYNFVKTMRERYEKLDTVEMSIWECCELLNEFVDESDPDLDEPQIEHLLQTAESIRKDYPDQDWLHLTGLIHDLGKVLLHPSFGELPQWAVVGDTFPVGCAFDESNIHFKYFKENPDYSNPAYNTKNGIYTEGCGLNNVMMSWGHDDYMYMVAKENKTTLPSAALFIIRYHSFYPLHKCGEYKHLMNDEDKKNLKWLHIFNKYDLYSKSKVRIDVEKVKPYYLSLIEKYFPAKLRW